MCAVWSGTQRTIEIPQAIKEHTNGYMVMGNCELGLIWFYNNPVSPAEFVYKE